MTSDPPVDWLDIGCAGSRLARVADLVGARRRLGVDQDLSRVEQARAEGSEARLASPESLALSRRSLTLITMVHHTLPRIGSRRKMLELITEVSEAVQTAAVFILPHYDANARLWPYGYMLQSSNWTRNANLPTGFDFCQAVLPLVTAGSASLTLYGRKPIKELPHPAVRAMNPFSTNLTQNLLPPLFEEMVVVVARYGSGSPVIDADQIAHTIGGCTLLNRFEPGRLELGYRPAPTLRSNLANMGLATNARHTIKGSPKSLLFVCGVPRSGTTALTQLLNCHPAVALGIERYRFRIIGDMSDGLHPALFERERFLRFNAEDGAEDVFQKYAKDYVALGIKWESASIVGDKVPRAYTAVNKLLAAFPEAKFLFIAREPIEVAASWQRLADDPNEASWPPSNGYIAAVEEWNRGLAAACYWSRAQPDCFRTVAFEDLFGVNSSTESFPEGSLPRALIDIQDWLGIDIPENLGQAYKQILARRPDSYSHISETVRNYVATHANKALLRLLFS